MCLLELSLLKIGVAAGDKVDLSSESEPTTVKPKQRAEGC